MCSDVNSKADIWSSAADKRLLSCSPRRRRPHTNGGGGPQVLRRLTNWLQAPSPFSATSKLKETPWMSIIDTKLSSRGEKAFLLWWDRKLIVTGEQQQVTWCEMLKVRCFSSAVVSAVLVRSAFFLFVFYWINPSAAIIIHQLEKKRFGCFCCKFSFLFFSFNFFLCFFFSDVLADCKINK